MRRKVFLWFVSIATLAGIGAYLWFVDFHMTAPATKVRSDWNELFVLIFWIALIVALFVWGLLIYALVRFRAKKDGPKEGPHIHGNVKLEIAWTIAPAVVMAWLLVISFQGMFAIEEPEETPDFTIKVTAYRFGWIFEYPDGTQAVNNTMRVEQNRMVKLELHSQDVIHAFGVPQLAVMKDVVPGRTNYAWFKADVPGEYLFNCRELCGVGHSKMGGKVIVFANGTDPGRMYGFAPPPATNDTAPADGVAVDLGRFVIEPAKLTSELGPKSFVVKNVDTIPHNLFIATSIDPANALWKTRDLAAGEQEVLNVNLDTDATYVIWCNVGGHVDLGMKGELVAGQGGSLAAEETPLLPGFESFIALAALPFAVLLFRRR